MAFVVGFLPWIVYWVLVGNVPFQLAVLVAVPVSGLALLVGRLRHLPGRTLDTGTLVVFVVLAVLAFVLPDDVLERWLQPLGNAGLLAVVLAGLAVGRPFVLDYATPTVDAVTARTDGFRAITTAMTWLWAGLFALMTLLSAIPPVVDGSATMLDSTDTLSILCYWVAPFVLLGLGGTVSGAFPPWFASRSAEVDARSAGDPATVAQGAPPPDASDGLEIDLVADRRHDEPFDLVVRGADGHVELEVEGTDLVGRTWRSRATLPAGADGVVDADRATPTGGDWEAPDGDAPIWAMRCVGAPAGADPTPSMFVPPAEPWQVTVRARSGGRSATRTVRRHTAGPGVRIETVHLGGRVAHLALPADAAAGDGLAAVACFGGSEGGSDSQLGLAAALASRGLVALAASWITEEDAATAVQEVPLERFAEAFDLLAGHAAVDPARVGATAISRGSEGVLAAAVAGLVHPTALVLVSPSSVTWQAIGGGGEVPGTPSWTLRGAPLPWQPLPSGVLMTQLVRNACASGATPPRTGRPCCDCARPTRRASRGAQGDGAGTATPPSRPRRSLSPARPHRRRRRALAVRPDGADPAGAPRPRRRPAPRLPRRRAPDPVRAAAHRGAVERGHRVRRDTARAGGRAEGGDGPGDRVPRPVHRRRGGA